MSRKNRQDWTAPIEARLRRNWVSIAASMIAIITSVFVIVAQSGALLQLTPSDSTAGGGTGDIYWSQVYGADGNFPTVNDCLSLSTKGALTLCHGTNGDGYGRPFSGTTYIRKLVCNSIESPTSDWSDAATFIDVAVYEMRGGDNEGVGTWEKNRIGSASLRFSTTFSALAGVSYTLEINEFTTLSDGVIGVSFFSMDAATSGGTATIDMACTVFGVE